VPIVPADHYSQTGFTIIAFLKNYAFIFFKKKYDNWSDYKWSDYEQVIPNTINTAMFPFSELCSALYVVLFSSWWSTEFGLYFSLFACCILVSEFAGVFRFRLPSNYLLMQRKKSRGFFGETEVLAIFP
jgi:uncharacterized membrane protein